MTGEMSDASARSEQAAETSVPAIEMVDLCKSFGKFQAVDHLSLTVQQGEIFGLLGPNGSGKTTTINMVSGLSVPSSGKVRVMGYEIPHDVRRIRQILGSVPQETALYEELSAWANLDFHAELFDIPRKEKRERITRILELVQLLDRKDSRVSTFSGGMKRRLALGRALLHDPQLIYLDEPTLGVDVQSRRAIWDYILSLRDQGKTVLITTNYLEEPQARSHYCREGTGRLCDLLRAGVARAWPGLCLRVDAAGRHLLAHNAAHVGVGGTVQRRTRCCPGCSDPAGAADDSHLDSHCDIPVLSGWRHRRSRFRTYLVAKYCCLCASDLWHTCIADGDLL